MPKLRISLMVGCGQNPLVDAIAPASHVTDIGDVEAAECTEFHPADQVVDAATDLPASQNASSGNVAVEEGIQFNVGDRVVIQAGGRYDGLDATVTAAANPDGEIEIILDAKDGSYALCFPSEYLELRSL